MLFIFMEVVILNQGELIEAIDFIDLQIRLNKNVMKEVDDLGYDSSKMEDWDRIYNNILKHLKEEVQ